MDDDSWFKAFGGIVVLLFAALAIAAAHAIWDSCHTVPPADGHFNFHRNVFVLREIE